MIFAYQPWVILFVLAVSNCGFWLFCFNRVNAAGFPRVAIKRTEKLIVFACFAIPVLIAFVEWEQLMRWLSTARWWPDDAPLFQWWGAWCLASGLVLGPLWLNSRRALIPPKHLLSSHATIHRLGRKVQGGSAGDRATQRLARIPGNQICDLEVTRKELLVPRPVRGIDGFKIGHLSDLHFTGQLRLAHYHKVIDCLLDLEPDLIVLTGDIIDSPECLGWIEPLLGRLAAPHGCTFVLGNHDLRLPSVDPLLRGMHKLGHFDVGIQDQVIRHGATRIALCGNEQPWFERHRTPELPRPRGQPALSPAPDSAPEEAGDILRIGVSHTPDQIAWARRRRLDLLLAGHTHGGQMRLPGIGPLLAPSMHGSKFASGVFYLAPTLMHVSRGVAGVHAVRLRCPPEVSLLTLRNASSNEALQRSGGYTSLVAPGTANLGSGKLASQVRFLGNRSMVDSLARKSNVTFCPV